MSEEWEYFIRLLTFTPAMTFVHEDMFWVRDHEAGQLSKGYGSPRHARSNYRSIRLAAEQLEGTHWWQPEVRRGLLRRARSSYITLLRFGNAEEIRAVETWLLSLAQAAGDRKVPASVSFRRMVGTRLFLMGFEFVQARCSE